MNLTELEIRPKTICVNCKWCTDVYSSDYGWMEQCISPTLAPVGINSVTGKKTQEVLFCENINKGDCRHFQTKPPPPPSFFKRHVVSLFLLVLGGVGGTLVYSNLNDIHEFLYDKPAILEPSKVQLEIPKPNISRVTTTTLGYTETRIGL